jgi:hypothetical protein
LNCDAILPVRIASFGLALFRMLRNLVHSAMQTIENVEGKTDRLQSLTLHLDAYLKGKK